MDVNKLDKRLQNLTPKIWSKLNEIDQLRGQWITGAQLSPQVLGRLKRATLITSTAASTRIEGAKLSDEDVEKLMRGLDIQKFSNRDKQEVRGYLELLEKVFDSWKSINFSEGSIKHLHKELLKYVEKDSLHRGEYKNTENQVRMLDEDGKMTGVILFDTTPAYLTPKETQEVVEWTGNALKERNYHPLLIVGSFLVEFLNIHPFQDGNGRLSRILTNLLLLKEGYVYMPYVSHEKLIENNKPDYYIVLRKSQKTFQDGNGGNITPWLDFFLSIVLEQSKRAVDLLSKANIEKILSPKQLLVWQYLQIVEEVTPGEIAAKVDIARPTVNQALNNLLKLKKVERIGLGRTTRYRKL